MPSHPEESHHVDLVIHILTELGLSEQSTFKKVDLECLGVTVDRFEATDSNFLDDRKKCLFKPFHQKLIKRWKIPDSEAAYESVHDPLDIQDMARNSRLASNPSESEIADATADVIAYLTTNITFLREGRSKIPLAQQLGWSDIDYEEFTGGHGGLLSSTPGRYKGKNFPGWDFQWLQEWWTKDSSENDILAGPSAKILIFTDGIGKEDRLLLSEFGAIVQVIMFRRIQPEFKHHHIFPVLMLSFFGPRHGRILQACYDSHSQQLELRISPIFSFLEKDNESFDLFLRFMASSPPEIMDLDLSELSLQSRATTRAAA
ncbi:hypothetical protein N7516_003627 [Penicillium verrucosum]|uniref:uncharacterized protein n=1 Tax=Penicillium verrucosum TaxID=60171 RepID=UPI00254508AC|nr:uncharacterized protein N7516_003627 [Penicillium verrucosum]KAJ5943459.1 hypothetical protein N7516_003627 [Penicillium verrucosum]